MFYNRIPEPSTIQLKNKTGFVQRPMTLPTDVTLKLSDGNINAHKMMLAMVSPVFEKMLFGGFKEGKLDEVKLPTDNCRIFNLLLSAIFNESCEMESLNDIFSLMEVAERYQINKAPLQQMCSEAILSELSYCTYLTILPKYACLMNDDSLRKAAGMVVLFTKNAWIKDFNKAKILPEEVLFFLLKRKDIPCSELDVFRYLVKWYKYQTTDLGNALQLTSQLFRCIRYSLIFPQVLLTEVASCEAVDKQLITKALSLIYTGCNPFENCNDVDDNDDDYKQAIDSRIPYHSLQLENMKWVMETRGVSISLSEKNICVKLKQVYYENEGQQLSIVSMELKKNRIYSFCIRSGRSVSVGLSVSIVDRSTSQVLSNTDLPQLSLITLQVYNGDIFIKVIDTHTKQVKSHLYSSGPSSYAICIDANSKTAETYLSHSFEILPA